MATMKTVINTMCNSEEEEKMFRAVVKQFGDWDSLFTYPEDCRDASAGVSGFIYYVDTEKFAKRQIVNILHVLNDFEEEIGEPLIKDNDNLLNWYAWFALEHTVQLIMDYKEK